MRQKQAFDTHGDLLIQRHKQGIQLVRPNNRQGRIPQPNISSLYNLPIPVYFYDPENKIIDGNEGAVEIASAKSIHDLRGNTVKKFVGKELDDLVSKNNRMVLQSESMNVIEESGIRVNNTFVSVMSFKLPWYYDNKIIGLLGCSIKMDAMSLHNFGNAFLALMSTGLINATHSPIKTHHGIYFSRREEEVLAQLVRGKTAKQIGEKLNLSPRTIESYVENMKIKTNCQSKAELIDKFVDEFFTRA
ncbi:MAG TPA: helix-turn-helix transcriptional regulator [Gammaproteobacteria bacterium]|nr:helix-turn-helix transcriptional regulator [Gammaproteobacteria bacterium]